LQGQRGGMSWAGVFQSREEGDAGRAPTLLLVYHNYHFSDRL